MFIKKPTNQQYDTVIIGAGPAGITTAIELAKKSQQKILIVESGSFERTKKINLLSQVKASGDLVPHYYPNHAQRVFGGTSSVWMGFCSQLEERAFNNNEWPISFSDISPYYQPAAEILELPENAFSYASSSIQGAENITYRPYYLSRPPVRFGEKYADLLRGHSAIDVLTQHTCTHINQSNGQIDHITVTDSLDPNSSGQIHGKNFILACGGLGNPKLLLQNKIGIDSPVGNYFMEHPHLYNVASMEIDESFINPLKKGDKVSHAIQLSDEYCVANNLLSITADIRLHPKEKRLFLGQAKTAYVSSVTLRSEMPALMRNKVTLTDKKDYLGQAIPHVDFSFSSDELIKKSWSALSKELVKSGMGRASSTLNPEVKMTGGGHYIGTTRMGLSPQDSVVNKNGKIHSLDNLYITGSSIFPASAAANPTYSIVAFALRLADHLSQS